jgi:peptidoglycan LD-endopeptidase CwlK
VNIYVLRLQKLVNLAGYSPALKEDGEYGPKTEAGIVWLENLLRGYKPDAIPIEEESISLDARSEKNVGSLLPKVQSLARKWYAQCHEQGIRVVIISGTRTFAEQEELYAQGRTKPGNIITKARGGYSNHNFGVAFDFCIFPTVNAIGGVGQPVWDGKEMNEAGAIGERLGLEWGGAWDFQDKPHLEYKTGLTLAQMREKVKRGEAVV